jgi:UDP-GlcNAc3NAcA epimerase
MLDAAQFYSRYSSSHSDILNSLSLAAGQFVLCTIHRAENTDDAERLTSIVRALNVISREMRIVLPLHPRTNKLLQSLDIQLNFSTIEPVGYFDMLELLKGTLLVLTDSGGLQKEAFFFAKPCVTLREETEWVELCECGANLLVGAHEDHILQGFHKMRESQNVFADKLYGNGLASETIVKAIINSTRTAKQC